MITAKLKVGHGSLLTAEAHYLGGAVALAKLLAWRGWGWTKPEYRDDAGNIIPEAEVRSAEAELTLCDLEGAGAPPAEAHRILGLEWTDTPAILAGTDNRYREVWLSTKGEGYLWWTRNGVSGSVIAHGTAPTEAAARQEAASRTWGGVHAIRSGEVCLTVLSRSTARKYGPMHWI